MTKKYRLQEKVYKYLIIPSKQTLCSEQTEPSF